MARSTNYAASRQNQVQHFLIKYCDEEGTSESRGRDLWDAFVHLFYRGDFADLLAKQHPNTRRLMDQGSFYRTLEECGLRRRSDRTGRGREVCVIFEGVRLLPPPPPPVEPMVLASAKKLVAVDPPTRVEPRASASAKELVAVDPPPWTRSVSPSHVEIQKYVFGRDLVATFKPIKPFKRYNSDEYCTHIVTFKNGELKHLFLTKDEATKLSEDLQLSTYY